MDWAKTKTIFIIIFLVLNLYLIFELMSLKSEDKLEVAKELTIEEKLKNEKISYGSLPSESIEASKISAEPKSFTLDEFSTIDGISVDLSIYTNPVVKFDSPVDVNEKSSAKQMNGFLEKYVINGEIYQFIRYDKMNNQMIFYQRYNKMTFYQSSTLLNSAQLVVQLNPEHQAIGYSQTMLTEFNQLGEEQPIIPALKAIENLYNKDYLPPNSEIEIDLGYLTLFQTTYQVLEPVWHITVDGKEEFFVTAIDGEIHQLTNKSEEN